ncbi:hypothetical protein NDU88_004563 [Pleurodeles waltl]|uniref:Uncharacterized protein n=1 Tax=Pleurodeles waltl TaxID=8319 RepID=A0AAV7QF87_PLEWA|nr:hypothetical protein NDU88_004563 [Pleurodeles waltl]
MSLPAAHALASSLNRLLIKEQHDIWRRSPARAGTPWVGLVGVPPPVPRVLSLPRSPYRGLTFFQPDDVACLLREKKPPLSDEKASLLQES